MQNPDSKSELNILNCKLNRIISEVDKTYRDRLSGLLSEEDFLRIYRRINAERTALQDTLNKMEKDKNTVSDIAISSDELVEQFLEQIYTSRELLVSLIERIELTENKEILVKFRFRKPETISYAQSFTIAAANSIPH